MNDSVERGRTRTINLEPNWEGMRRWVLHVYKTDPETARRIAMNMGTEAPQLPDDEPEPFDASPIEPGSYEHPDFE